MESRNISLTLQKAKEWYNSSSAELREVALQAYTEDELKTITYEDITSVEKACKTLGLDYIKVRNYICSNSNSSDPMKEHMGYIYLLDIVRKALNGDWEPKLTDDKIYGPWVRFYPVEKAKEVATNNDWKTGASFVADGKKYTLVGGDCYSFDGGLGYLGCGYGDVSTYLGLLGCKSEKIARHMGKYFSKLIFNAVYSQHRNFTWV